MGGWTGNGKDGISWDGKLDSKSGEIQHTPVNDLDIVNKVYVDNLTTDHPHQDVTTTAEPEFAKLGIGLTAPLLKLHVDGKMVLGNSVTLARLNSNSAGGRSINVIDTNAVFRIWRYGISGAGFEMVNGVNDNITSLDNAWWDVVLQGTGTTSKMLFRSRVGGVSQDILRLIETGGIKMPNSAGHEVVHLGPDSNGDGYLQLDEGSAGVAKLQFRTDGNHNYILAGNFGLGVSSPDSKLKVNGDAGYVDATDMGTTDADFASKKYVDDNIGAFNADIIVVLDGAVATLDGNVLILQ